MMATLHYLSDTQRFPLMNKRSIMAFKIQHSSFQYCTVLTLKYFKVNTEHVAEVRRILSRLKYSTTSRQLL